MHDLVRKYMDNLGVEDVNNFALKNNIMFSNEELDFTYSFIKKNWEAILTNPNSLQLYLYKLFSLLNAISVQKREDSKKIQYLLSF